MAEIIKVEYCEHCGLPEEYCEFHPIHRNDPRFSATEDVAVEAVEEEEVATEKPVEEEEEEESEKEAEKEEEGESEGGQLKSTPLTFSAKKEEPKPVKAPVKKGTAGPKVVLSQGQRKHKKIVTIVTGLDTFGHKPKAACKILRKKFACSVSAGPNPKSPAVQDITIQGDVMYDVPQFLHEAFKVPRDRMFMVNKEGAVTQLS